MFNLKILFSPLRRYFSTERKLLSSLRQIIGFYPGNIALYKLAFKHRSIPDNYSGTEGHVDTSNLGASTKENYNNERLEYLGDAILGAIIAHYLFKRFPYQDEGFLTQMRSKIVSRAYLNKLSIKMGLNKFINPNSTSGSKSINGDTFEALIGAIYIDKGYECAKEFILNRIIKYHIDIDEIEATEVNYKGKLIDWAQKERKKIIFEVLDVVGRGYGKKYCIQVMIEDRQFGKGMDFSKKKAEQRAAEETCRMLGI